MNRQTTSSLHDLFSEESTPIVAKGRHQREVSFGSSSPGTYSPARSMPPRRASMCPSLLSSQGSSGTSLGSGGTSKSLSEALENMIVEKTDERQRRLSTGTRRSSISDVSYDYDKPPSGRLHIQNQDKAVIQKQQQTYKEASRDAIISGNKNKLDGFLSSEHEKQLQQQEDSFSSSDDDDLFSMFDWSRSGGSLKEGSKSRHPSGTDSLPALSTAKIKQQLLEDARSRSSSGKSYSSEDVASSQRSTRTTESLKLQTESLDSHVETVKALLLRNAHPQDEPKAAEVCSSTKTPGSHVVDEKDSKKEKRHSSKKHGRKSSKKKKKSKTAELDRSPSSVLDDPEHQPATSVPESLGRDLTLPLEASTSKSTKKSKKSKDSKKQDKPKRSRSKSSSAEAQ